MTTAPLLSLQLLSARLRQFERVTRRFVSMSQRCSSVQLNKTDYNPAGRRIITYNACGDDLLTKFPSPHYDVTIRGMVLMTVMRSNIDNSNGKTGNKITCKSCLQVYNNNVHGGTDGSSTSEGVDLVKVVSCPNCGALQSIRHHDLPNYFEILGQNESYHVDIVEISTRAKQLQKKFHPDLYSQRGEEQQALSQDYSSLINKAVSTLSNPISRGRYMLTICNGASEDPNRDLEETVTNDPEFLEEVMELNWQLEEISTENDWKEFQKQNMETMKEIQLELEMAFDQNEMKEAKRLLGRLKYFDTLQHKLKDLQSKIGIVE